MLSIAAAAGAAQERRQRTALRAGQIVLFAHASRSPALIQSPGVTTSLPMTPPAPLPASI
jgi:hypothetical protein